MNILFIDGVTQKHYNSDSLAKREKIGGTEITLIRAAELLAREHNVYVAQRAAAEEVIVNNIHYLPYAGAKTLSGNQQPDHIIIIRPRHEVKLFARHYPSAKIYYWMHDIPGKRLWKYKRIFSKYNVHIIAISEFQRTIIDHAWQGVAWQRLLDQLFPCQTPTVATIYNPISDDLVPDNTQVIDNKLLFFSAPDRGLSQILIAFNKVKQVIDDFRLYLAHPGYASLAPYRQQLNHPDIILLGALANQEIIQHIREAFCIFYPQTARPECFGLVYAEANALGTPVLAHDFGAAREVLSGKEQLINACHSNEIIGRLQHWRQHGRPKITLKEQFRPLAVKQQWERLLG